MQDVSFRHMSVDVNDPAAFGLPLRIQHRESVDSTMFSIQSSKSPIGKKVAHTMLKNTDAVAFPKFDIENGGSINCTPKVYHEEQESRKVVIEVPNLMPEPVSKRLQATKVDAGTQVYQVRSLLKANDLCQYDGCFKQAAGGTCDFRVCCSTGCKRQVCQDHIATKDPEAEDDDFMSRVC